MAEPPHIVRADDPIARGGVELAGAVAAVLAERDQVRLAIPGGSALAALGHARGRLGEGWRRVRLTWVDERCVPFDDPESNRGTAYRTGALCEDTPPADELPLFVDDEAPASAVSRVEAGLEARFDGGLDVLLLGMGPDGHVASLFPGWPEPPGRRAAVVEQSPKPPARRITLTRPTLATSSRSVLIATGEEKRHALERLLAGDPALPAQGLKGLVVVTDLETKGAQR